MHNSLYAWQGVEEYWIIDWIRHAVDVYRRVEDDLALVAALTGEAVLTTPLLPGFSLSISGLWAPSFDERVKRGRSHLDEDGAVTSP